MSPRCPVDYRAGGRSAGPFPDLRLAPDGTAELSVIACPGEWPTHIRPIFSEYYGDLYSINHIAGILGIRKQSLHELMRKGQALLEAQRVRLGVVSLRERRGARLVEAGILERRAV